MWLEGDLKNSVSILFREVEKIILHWKNNGSKKSKLGIAKFVQKKNKKISCNHSSHVNQKKNYDNKFVQ